jgi:uncharacterized membrane protein
MSWITFAILTATSFGFYNFFTKLAADKLSPTIALMFIAGASFLVAIISTIGFKISGQELTFSKNAIWFPILAGIFTGVAEIFYLYMFTKDAPLNIGAPLVIGITILATVLLGLIVLKEPLNAVKIAGICLTIIGLVILTRG